MLKRTVKQVDGRLCSGSENEALFIVTEE